MNEYFSCEKLLKTARRGAWNKPQNLYLYWTNYVAFGNDSKEWYRNSTMERNTERIPVTLFGITANIIFAKPHVKWKDAYIDMYLHLSGVKERS